MVGGQLTTHRAVPFAVPVYTNTFTYIYIYDHIKAVFKVYFMLFRFCNLLERITIKQALLASLFDVHMDGMVEVP